MKEKKKNQKHARRLSWAIKEERIGVTIEDFWLEVIELDFFDHVGGKGFAGDLSFEVLLDEFHLGGIKPEPCGKLILLSHMISLPFS